MKTSNLLRGAQKGLQIYVVKLNKVDDPKSGNDPEWLSEFRDIFPQELNELPPSREVDHEIEVIPRSSPVSKCTYKMSLPEAMELKEQLRQLLVQGFIKPSNSRKRRMALFSYV